MKLHELRWRRRGERWQLEVSLDVSDRDRRGIRHDLGLLDGRPATRAQVARWIEAKVAQAEAAAAREVGARSRPIVQQMSFGSGGPSTRLVSSSRFTFAKFSADARMLFGRNEGGILLYPGEGIRVQLNDSFVGLTQHTFCCEGTVLQAPGQPVV